MLGSSKDTRKIKAKYRKIIKAVSKKKTKLSKKAFREIALTYKKHGKLIRRSIILVMTYITLYILYKPISSKLIDMFMKSHSEQILSSAIKHIDVSTITNVVYANLSSMFYSKNNDIDETFYNLNWLWANTSETQKVSDKKVSGVFTKSYKYLYEAISNYYENLFEKTVKEAPRPIKIPGAFPETDDESEKFYSASSQDKKL